MTDFRTRPVGDSALTVEFEKKIDLDYFFRKTASLALVPLREDIVSANPNWAKKASSLITNGPFDVKKLSNGDTLRLERRGSLKNRLLFL